MRKNIRTAKKSIGTKGSKSNTLKKVHRYWITNVLTAPENNITGTNFKLKGKDHKAPRSKDRGLG